MGGQLLMVSWNRFPFTCRLLWTSFWFSQKYILNTVYGAKIDDPVCKLEVFFVALPVVWHHGQPITRGDRDEQLAAGKLSPKERDLSGWWLLMVQKNLEGGKACFARRICLDIWFLYICLEVDEEYSEFKMPLKHSILDGVPIKLDKKLIWAMVNTHYMVDGHPIHNKDPYNGY